MFSAVVLSLARLAFGGRLRILRRFLVESCLARRRAEVISVTLVLAFCSRFWLVDCHSTYWIVCSCGTGFRLAQHFISPFIRVVSDDDSETVVESNRYRNSQKSLNHVGRDHCNLHCLATVNVRTYLCPLIYERLRGDARVRRLSFRADKSCRLRSLLRDSGVSKLCRIYYRRCCRRRRETASSGKAHKSSLQ